MKYDDSTYGYLVYNDLVNSLMTQFTVLWCMVYYALVDCDNSVYDLVYWMLMKYIMI